MLQPKPSDPMVEVPRRLHGISVAIPSSLTEDVPHLREKTSRAGIIARSLAIFRVEEAIIYNDKPSERARYEGKLLEKLLTFEETPPYLRRRFFPKDPDLQFAGTLPPLRTPNHPDLDMPRIGLLREGIVLESGKVSQVDAGFRTMVEVHSTLKRLSRVTIQLTRTEPRLEAKVLDRAGLAIYWGFKVTRGNFTLAELLRSRKQDLRISTSRKGRIIREVLAELKGRWKASHHSLVMFGSPAEGVPEILSREGSDIAKIVDFNLNMIPNQGVETVRTEEAILAALSALNLLEEV